MSRVLRMQRLSVAIRAASRAVTLGRVSIDLTVQQQLDRLGVPFEIFPCDPALADTANFCAAYGFAPEDSANTILVIGKSDPPVYAACVVLSNTRLDVNRVVRQRLGTRKASFAPAEETRAITGMEIGGVTVFGLPPEMPILIDARVLGRERIVLGGGSRSTKVIAPPAILLKLPGAEVVEGLATEFLAAPAPS
jgi:prolyl-tRNA editing enzyme YbaK/EbsC (Cys-tRNA(Pro) deacylase)